MGFSGSTRAVPRLCYPSAMVPLWHPVRFLLVALAGWINQQQRDVIDHLQEENRVLREQLGPRRLRFTNDQRIRLAAKATTLGRTRADGDQVHRDTGHLDPIGPFGRADCLRRGRRPSTRVR